MIVVFGSTNMDMSVPARNMPEPGETVICPAFEMSPGGKGANQALAALRSGAKVALVSRVGDDGMGIKMVTGLRREGVMTSGVAHSEKPTGCAFIIRDENGENRIIVASGANADISADQVPDEILKRGNVLLMQMETPEGENWKLLKRARENGAMTILNLAPAKGIPEEVLSNIDILILNQIEARQTAERLGLDADKDDVLKLAEALSRKGHLTCVITLGGKGAIAWTCDNKPFHVPPLKIDKVVDTTGAGDAFCGTLAAGLHDNLPFEEAMRRASIAGSLACTKKGAQESFPWLGEIEEKLKTF